jgi:anti-sigma regulatory factor (Ser/Thr protein kinase)
MSQHFAPAIDAPREARRFVRDALRRWSLDHLVEPCQVVVSELATNAVRHADSRFSVSLSRIGGGAVHLAVGDLSDAPPEQRTPDAQRPGGRGMHLVESLSQRWGHVASSGGKLVWAVVGGVG